MALNTQETRDLYRRRAARYDLAVRLFGLVGMRLDRYRMRAVHALALRPGDTAVDLGCGTGLNLPLLVKAVGPAGHVIGVDLTDAMLDQARRRVEDAGWPNVELVQSDMAAYAFPSGLGGVLSTLALTLALEYDAIIRRAARSLRPGGRLAVFDLKRPEGWPEPLVRLAAWLNRPYGVSLDLADRHPWESIRSALREVVFQNLYGGMLYLSVGEAR
jgi:demethylmenaquinone methyltransferase/2-methoxy-6-polyprenyl-1,4-benzoquinol methylase